MLLRLIVDKQVFISNYFITCNIPGATIKWANVEQIVCDEMQHPMVRKE